MHHPSFKDHASAWQTLPVPPRSQNIWMRSEKPSLSASQRSQTSSLMYLFNAYCLRRMFHLHAVKHADERQIPFPNSAKNLGTGKTQCFL